MCTDSTAVGAVAAGASSHLPGSETLQTIRYKEASTCRGFFAAIQLVFNIHQPGHGNALSVSGWPVLVDFAEMKATIE